MVNQFGEVITAEGAEAIRKRQEHKAALLSDLRAQRVSAGLDRQSHVGAELGRNVPDAALQYQLRKSFAELSNLMMIEEHQEAAAILASLARGIDRASHEMFGTPTPDEGLAIEEASKTLAAATGDTVDRARMAIESAIGPDDISQRSDDISQRPKSEPQKPLSFEDATGPVTPLATFEDDDYDDMPGADEPAVSPEPQDTPARKAAAQRRQAKAASKGTDPK